MPLEATASPAPSPITTRQDVAIAMRGEVSALKNVIVLLANWQTRRAGTRAAAARALCLPQTLAARQTLRRGRGTQGGSRPTVFAARGVAAPTSRPRRT